MGKKTKDTVLECKNLCFSYKNHSDEFSLKSVELGLFPGRCLGVIGLNGQGKSTLCKVLSKARMYGGGDVDFKPSKGKVFYHPRDSEKFERLDPYQGTLVAAVIVGFCLTSFLAITLGPSEVDEGAAVDVASLLWLAGLVVISYGVDVAMRRTLDGNYRGRVVYCSTEHDLAKHVLKDAWGLNEAITGSLKGALTEDERLALCERLLTWAGFRMFKQDDSGDEYGDPYTFARDAALTCGALSGGQRHLVYFLRCLAPCFCPKRERFLPVCLWQKQSPSRVDVLLLDEAFNCLDAHVRPRALRLARHCVDAFGVSVVVVCQNLHEMAAICDDACCVHGGALVEAPRPVRELAAVAGPAAAKLHADARTYVDAYWELERDVRERDPGAARLAVSAYAAAAGEELRRAVASLPPVAALGPPWDAVVLARGDAVRIDGLGAQRRFNGKKGRVLGELGEGAAHRVKVALPDGQSLAVRRSNLAKVADAAPADKKRD